MSRLGLHVKTGSRNGYGLVIAESPAVVFSVGEGGAVLEAMDNGIWGIYRDIEHYNNHPEGMGLNDPNLSRADAFSVAETMYPLLVEQWKKNPADFYAVINESGANDTSVIKNYVNYEWRMMELAEEDGYKLCLCNLFSGTPDDGSVADGEPNGGMQTWKIEYGPLLRRGAEGGHIYGRHSYGFQMLTPVDQNSDRPFREAKWLREQGIEIGIVLSECGLYGGEHQTDVTTTMEQIYYYDFLLKGSPYADMFLGMCWWTYGDWAENVNIETISAQLAAYLKATPSEPWEPGGYVPPPTDREPNRIRHTIHLLPQVTSDEERHAVVEALKATNTAFTHSHDVVEAVMYHSTTDGEIVAWNPERWDFDLEKYFSWLNVRYTVRDFKELVPNAPRFQYKYWPVIGDQHVTQLWGARPVYYKQFGVPGHGGVDMRAPRGTLIRCVADGVVERVWLDEDSHNFGIHVYVKHGFGELSGYAHLLHVESLAVGQFITAGTIVGVADNTGNSSGDHLHFLRKRPGETYEDKHGEWAYNLFDPTALLKAVAPNAYWPDEPVPTPVPPPTTGKKYNIYEAMTISELARGPLYEVRTEIWSGDRWTPGPQERHQTHMSPGKFYHTKGGDGEHKHAQWEELMADLQLVYRSIDTSPGDNQYYRIADELGGYWSAWCPRYMAVGETYFRYPFVTFHDKDTCEIATDGRQPSQLLMKAFHEGFTFFTGITLANVVELEWLDTDNKVLERYYYAKGYGLVGWGYGDTGRRAAISEIHAPGARDDNIREVIDCL